MSLLATQLDQITATQLSALIVDKIIESHFIEYKQTVGLAELSDKIKFLAGVSSFANAAGGDIIIGMRAVKGIPVELVGVSIDEIDDVKLRLEQIIQTGVSPRVQSMIQTVAIGNSRVALIIRVSRSWAQPHRVTLAGHDKFYGRHSAGRFPMDVDQLRAAFINSSTLNHQIYRIRERLIEMILQAKTPVPIPNLPMVVMQMIPYESLDPSRSIDLGRADALASLLLTPLGQSNAERRFNLDGIFASFSRSLNDDPEIVLSYTQLYRSGMIESVTSDYGRRTAPFGSHAGTTAFLPSTKIEADILKGFKRFLKLQRNLDVSPPIVVMVSILNAAGCALGVVGAPYSSHYEIDRSDLILPPVIVNNYEDNRATVLRPVFDALWNAGGYPRCQDYNDDGSLKPELSRFLNDYD